LGRDGGKYCFRSALQPERFPILLAKHSIRAKITAVVAFLLVALTGMGLLAVRNMRAINAATQEISRNVQ